MKTRTIGLLVVMLGMLLVAVACSQTAPVQPSNTQPAAQPGNTSVSPTATTPAPAPAVDAQALLQQNCTRCHNLDRVTNSRHTAQEWQAIVERMVGKGAQLSPDQIPVVVNYLAATYPK
jgi:hypothetical protein